MQTENPVHRRLPVLDADLAPGAPPGLPSFRHYVPRAGHPDFPRLLAEAKAAAARVRATAEPPRPLAEDLARRAASLGTAARGWVENRRRAKAGREDLLPLYFIWTTHRACNFTCSYCDDHQGHRYPELSSEGALDTAGGERLLQILRTRASSVYFAGGEPTLRKDLPALLRRARTLDYYPVIVNTNGSALARQLELPSHRTFLADVDVLVVSLDGLELDWLARTWRYDRPEDVFRALLLLRELCDEWRVKLVVNTVIQPGAIAHARDVLDLACDLGIWFSPVPMNAGPGVAGGLHDDPSYRALARLILERKAQGHRINGSARLNRRLLGSEPLVCRNTLKPHVDHDGRLFWPCKASVAVPPVTLDVLSCRDVDELWERGVARQDPRGFSERCGARCNWAQNYSTDAYAHGLEHPLSLLGEVAEFLSARRRAAS